MSNAGLRHQLERLSRNRAIRRSLPPAFGRRPIWVSPDARLRFLKFGPSAFDGDLLAWVDRLIGPGSVVLDIGANVGELALSAAHKAGPSGAVLAIDADPFLVFLLQRTISEARNKDVNLDAMCSAVSGGSGIARFDLSERGRAANALSTVGSSQMGGKRSSFWVPTVGIDQIIAAWQVPDFIKIDIEGAELAALTAAKETLGRHRPVFLFEAGQDRTQISALFGMHDYCLFDPGDSAYEAPLEICGFNTFAIPKERLDEVRRNGHVKPASVVRH